MKEDNKYKLVYRAYPIVHKITEEQVNSTNKMKLEGEKQGVYLVDTPSYAGVKHTDTISMTEYWNIE